MKTTKRNLGHLPVVLALGMAVSSHASTLVNGDFETGTTAGWTVAGNASASGSINYGGPGSVDPYQGSYSARLRTNGVSTADLASLMGVSKATLDDSNSATVSTNGSMIYQTVSAVPGDSFFFRWNFVEQDYLPFDDWAFYGISKDGAAATVTKFASLGSVGPGNGSTINGWETLVVNIQDAGDYTFYFGVVNAVDQGLDSDLWVDGIGVGVAPIPEPSTTTFALAAVGLALTRRKRK